MDKVKVGLLQVQWVDDPIEALEKVLELVDTTLQNNKLDLLCLPEFFTGAPWYMPNRAHLKGVIDDTIPGNITTALGKLAKKYTTYILCGTIVERDNDKYYNSCVLLNDEGEIVGKARKIHRYSSELSNIEAGTEQMLVDTPFGKLGVCICSDFWIPEMPRILALRGAEIICIPGGSLTQNISTTKSCMIANSVQNVCYTLYASIVGGIEGVRSGRKVSIKFEGHSSVAGPRGMIESLDKEPGVIITELDMNELRSLRQVDTSFKETLFWSLWGRQPDLYKRLSEPYVGAKDDLASLVTNYLNS
ncbi:carbon-nitrogen hydrolase family protein [Paenibacillus sp. NPDC057934]|uniref:carbon-nitrogen hydrolase family protein n=1 Tax=Paenibacillus sp. NPDC057934 TaxID=3346282 RepID=UPI0036DC733E